MFAGIDVASERHWLARLDDAGKPIGKPVSITEDRDGRDKLVQALGPAPVLVALEATGHNWQNLFSTLVAAGHDVAVLNPLVARRFQDASLERIKTDAIDGQGLARLAFEKRPAPSRLADGATEALRDFIGHRDRLRGLRAQPAAVRKAHRRPRRHRTHRPRPPEPGTVDVRARRRAPRRLAAVLPRAPPRCRKTRKARPHRRHAQVALRHLQRRQKPKAFKLATEQAREA